MKQNVNNTNNFNYDSEMRNSLNCMMSKNFDGGVKFNFSTPGSTITSPTYTLLYSIISYPLLYSFILIFFISYHIAFIIFYPIFFIISLSSFSSLLLASLSHQLSPHFLYYFLYRPYFLFLSSLTSFSLLLLQLSP